MREQLSVFIFQIPSLLELPYEPKQLMSLPPKSENKQVMSPVMNLAHTYKKKQVPSLPPTDEKDLKPELIKIRTGIERVIMNIEESSNTLVSNHELRYLNTCDILEHAQCPCQKQKPFKLIL